MFNFVTIEICSNLILIKNEMRKSRDQLDSRILKLEMFHFSICHKIVILGPPPQQAQHPQQQQQRQVEIQSRATGPFVTHPPKPTRVLHSEAYLRYMDTLDNGKPPESKWDRLIAKYDQSRAEQMVTKLLNATQQDKKGYLPWTTELSKNFEHFLEFMICWHHGAP